ncbi:hypothetical protein ES703_12121 [subsurface metagenome]
MGNAKMGQHTTYRTSDLYLAAWPLSNRLELLDIDRRNKQRNDFIFLNRRKGHSWSGPLCVDGPWVISLILLTTLRRQKTCCTLVKSKEISKEISLVRPNAPAQPSYDGHMRKN